jgi:NitT/TauT family transport system substrate-binding protein
MRQSSTVYRWFRVGQLALALLALSAFSAAAADHIRVGVVSSLGSAPIFIAAAKGYFKDEGLDADLVSFESAQPVAVAITSGDVDFGSTGMTDAFFILANQGALRLIGSGTYERTGFQNLGFIVSNKAYDAGVTSFEKFPDHSVGITQTGTPLHYNLGTVLGRHGVDLKTVRVIPLQSNPNVASAIIGGQVDAAVLSASNIHSVVNKGGAHIVSWLSDEIGSQQGDGTFTSTKIANERPDTVRHFMAAFRKAELDWNRAFLDANGKRADQATAPEMIAIVADGLKVSPDAVKQGIPYFDPESRVSVSDIQRALNWYEAQGMQKVHIDANALIDKRYAILMPE